MANERVLLHLSAQLIPKEAETLSEKDDFNIDDTTMIVGGGTYNGIYFPTEELEKAHMSFQGVPININHNDDAVEDIVGYVQDAYMNGDKLKGKTIFDKDTAKYNAVMGYIKSRFRAGDYPNVSIGVWTDKVFEDIGDDKKRLTARNVSADHLAVVVHGACNPDDGCGIGLSMADNMTFTWLLDTTDCDEIDADEKHMKELCKQIEIEKLKLEIKKELNK